MNAQYAYDYYVNKRGVPPAVAAGIVGNLQVESAFAPDVISGQRRGDSGTAFGAAQWRGSRLNNLMSYAKQRGMDAPDLNTQLDFVLHEMKSGSDAGASKAYKLLQNVSSPEDAAEIFMRHFERPNSDPGINHINRRKAYASKFGSGQQMAQAQSFDPTKFGATPIQGAAPGFKPSQSGAEPAKPFNPVELGAVPVTEQPEDVPQTDANAAQDASQAETDQPNILDDILGSLGAGVRRGTESLVGAIGDANQMTGQLAETGAKALGASPKTARTLGSILRRANPLPGAPTTERVRALTTPALGTSYEPQTTPGKYARTLGEFAPAMALGPGGVGRKALMTAVPAIASEAAGQATEGTTAEPFARAAGALAGGLAAAGRAPGTVSAAARNAPTAEQLKTQTDRLYGTLRSAGIKYDSNAYANSITKMADDLIKKGYRPSVAKDAFALVDDLTKEIGKSPDFDDISALVQMVGEKARAAARTGDKPTEAAFNIIRDNLNKMEQTAPIVSRVNLGRDEINRVKSAAREVAKRNIKQRALSEVMENADAYAAGKEAGIRNGIRNLVRSKRGKQLFDEGERKALLEVANGRKGLQTLSRFGFDISSISGNATFVPTIGAIGAGSAFGPAAGASLAVAGTAAKQLSPRLTERAFERTSAAIRSGKMKDPTIMNAAKAERLRSNVRRLISVEPTLNGVASPAPQPVQ